MTHEGRMARGEEKLSKGIQDIETEYFLAKKPKTRKGGKKMSDEHKKPVEPNSEEDQGEGETKEEDKA